MVNWQITATTIYCPAVDEEVTVMVAKDWSTRCTGFNKYSRPGKDTLNKLSKKSRQAECNLKCEGPECLWVVQYRDKLQVEENTV